MKGGGGAHITQIDPSQLRYDKHSLEKRKESENTKISS